jgi:bifunctional UDP-N-acetylglucosamine pyrophosphorylase / glucosamine-1-phosphate N-acetyltransferase
MALMRSKLRLAMMRITPSRLSSWAPGTLVLMAKPLLAGKADLILVTYGDMPLLRGETLQKLVQLHQQSGGPVTITSFIGDAARGFGRVVRAESGHVTAIVEQADATPEQLAIREYNVGAYCFSGDWLWSALGEIPVSPKGEYYLTDLVGLAVAGGFALESLVMADPDEAIGLNTRVHLAEAEKVMRKRINEAGCWPG